jgi:hypothetical protein
MKEQFKTHKFRPASLERIQQCNTILAEYANQGFSLTVRQLFYQLVARGLIPNTMRSYKRIVNLCVNAREAGLMDWHAIEDRARGILYPPHWENPAKAIKALHDQFRIDRWNDQDCHIEVMIEKDALAGVLEGICEDLDVRLIPNRGYSSASTMYRHAQRLMDHHDDGYEVHVFYLGDFDPSGLDMDRDIYERLRLYSNYASINFQRLALTMEQVEEHNPPPNPAKLSDSRAPAFVSQYGYESWELDALDPTTLRALVSEAVTELRDIDIHDKTMKREKGMKEFLQGTIEDWSAKADSEWPNCRGCGRNLADEETYECNVWYEPDRRKFDDEWVETGVFKVEVYCSDCYEEANGEVEPWRIGL